MLNSARERDLARRPVAAIIWWCMPIAIGVATAWLSRNESVDAAVWAMAFLWMSTGCTLNARRCHRLHCYISAPILFFGAVVLALSASGLVVLGPRAMHNVISATLVLALLSFIPEAIWGMYARPR